MNPVNIPELLAMVCSQMDKNTLLAAALVCHTWSKICIPFLWETCFFTAELYGEHHAVFDAHASMIRHLDAKHRLIGGDARFIAQQCPNLQTLSLRYCPVTPGTLEVLCVSSFLIESLTLDRCPGVKSSIVEKLSRLTRLSRLEIIIPTQERGEGDWREEHLVHLLTHCLELKTLGIKGPDLSHVHLLRLQSHPTMLELRDLQLISTFLSADALGRLLMKCPSLTALTLLSNANTNGMLHTIAQNCPRLERLGLRNSKSFSTTAFEQVFKSCPTLRDLDISFTLVQDTAVTTLASQCPHLERLDLTGCSRLTKDGLREVLERSTELRELRVKGCRKLSIAAFSSNEPWACKDRLEFLDMASVGIVAGIDELEPVIRQWRSMKRLRQLELDDHVGAWPQVSKAIKEITNVRVVVSPLQSKFGRD